MELTSSHSAPAVTNATRPSDTPMRDASLAVWEMNLSVANSRTKRVDTNTLMLYGRLVSCAIVFWS